jgi:Large ribosomal RNA subunit accumulation protein YceD
MSEQRSGERRAGGQRASNAGHAPWSVPVAVEDIDAETGQHFDLVADDAMRAAVAKVAALRELPRLQANFDVTRRGAGGLHAVGLVSATVGQNCVVTLEPLANEIEETIDLDFVPRAAPAPEFGETEGEPHVVKWGDPEPLIGGVVDLGALATEFLILGLDPYPRKPGAVFEPPQGDKPDPGPFAALAKLTKG